MNIYNYLKRQNTSFDELKFNQLDALIFAQLVYEKFENTYKPEDTFTLNDYYPEISINLELLLALHTSKRFRNLKIFNVSTYRDKESQFMAMTVELDEAYLIVVRGTDGTIEGWIENFESTYKSTNTQKLALKYVNEASKLDKPLILIGHSKGGNDVTYAAIKAKHQDRILAIYDFDGPGFYKDLFSTDAYQNIKDRHYRYLPRTCMIGVMMYQTPNYKIVASSGKGAYQHDLLTWQVLGNDFIYELGRDQTSIAFENATFEYFTTISKIYQRNIVRIISGIIRENEELFHKTLNEPSLFQVNQYLKLCKDKKDQDSLKEFSLRSFSLFKKYNKELDNIICPKCKTKDNDFFFNGEYQLFYCKKCHNYHIHSKNIKETSNE